ncbi:MAG: FAD-dependent monooxygenase [Pseudomonadota bacterium]
MIPNDISADVLIVGGGLSGPALALALTGAGLRAAVIDAQPLRARAEVAFDGRAYALSIASQRLLAAVGVWEALAPVAQPIREIKASDGRPGEGVAPFFLHFDAAEIEEGPMGFMVEDRHLYAAFHEAMERAGAALLPGVTVAAQEAGEAGATVTLADGRVMAGRVIAGCDGRGSGTALRAGISRTGWDYRQTAVVCALEHERPHNGVAQQVFLPTGPLAILPLTGNRSSIVWSETGENATALMAADEAMFAGVLAERIGGALGAFRVAGARFAYPLSLSLAERYVAPRVALVGDAAHGVHPIAGQGLNLGFRDVGALAEVLVTAARRGEDIGAADVLARYQTWRRFDATALALGMDAVNRLFSNDNPVLRVARDLGMGVVSSLPGLRRAFIRQAAGLSGDVPRLLAGKRL